MTCTPPRTPQPRVRKRRAVAGFVRLLGRSPVVAVGFAWTCIVEAAVRSGYYVPSAGRKS